MTAEALTASPAAGGGATPAGVANEAGIGRGNRLADGVAGCAGTLATRIQRLKPYDPQVRARAGLLLPGTASTPSWAGGYHREPARGAHPGDLLEAGENVLVARVETSPQTPTQSFYERQQDSTCHAAHADQQRS